MKPLLNEAAGLPGSSNADILDRVYDEDGTERLDGNEQGYEPKDFQYRDPNDALRSALWMIDRYWLQGERWHISDEERLSLNLR